MLTIATRKSRLALWQANHIAGLIEKKFNLPTQLLPKTTEGDRSLDRPLSSQGGKALFLKELQLSLRANEADIAVHSLKDVPVEENDAFTLAAIMKRASPFDAFISPNHSSLSALPNGSVVGTSSSRRTSQILHHFPHLKIKPLRGNINTRIEKCFNGTYDAIVLAKAGLDRLEMSDLIKETISSNICLSAASQGILAIECLSSRTDLINILSKLECASARICANTERSFVKALGGDCASSIACYAQIIDNTIHLSAMVASLDGKTKLVRNTQGKTSLAEKLSQQIADDMIKAGALKLIEQNNHTLQ